MSITTFQIKGLRIVQGGLPSEESPLENFSAACFFQVAASIDESSAE